MTTVSLTRDEQEMGHSRISDVTIRLPLRSAQPCGGHKVTMT